MTNETINVLLKRRSVRGYKPTPLTKDQISLLVDAALAAPSANNLQPWRINVITNRELLVELDKALMSNLEKLLPDVYESMQKRGGAVLYNAPALFLITIPSSDKSLLDAGIQVENIAIAAKAIGLDSVIIGLFMYIFQGADKAQWIKRLQIEDGYEFGISIAVGEADENVQVREFVPDYWKVKYLE
jgi:nitroreductase